MPALTTPSRPRPPAAPEGCSPPCARAAQAEQRLADRTRALELEVRELRAALAASREATRIAQDRAAYWMGEASRVKGAA